MLDFPPQPVITKDNVTMQIDSVVFCKVFDPKLFCYGVENPMAGLQNLSATTLRSIIGDMELDATLTSREMINAKMQKVLDEATDAWGIKVTRVEIKNIQPPKEIEEVMTKQMRAERERRQTVLEAQRTRRQSSPGRRVTSGRRSLPQRRSATRRFRLRKAAPSQFSWSTRQRRTAWKPSRMRMFPRPS